MTDTGFNPSGRSPTPYEIILLYAIGLEPKQIIALGFSENTVYKYKKHYQAAGERLKKLIGDK